MSEREREREWKKEGELWCRSCVVWMFVLSSAVCTVKMCFHLSLKCVKVCVCVKDNIYELRC